MVIWITGKAGAGKTTLAYRLKYRRDNAIVLDGDEIRDIYHAGYSDKSRSAHIISIGKLAGMLEGQGFTVIVALVSPKQKWRDEARSYCIESELIYVMGGKLWPGTTYEEPDDKEPHTEYEWR